jgi:riboflavin synthase
MFTGLVERTGVVISLGQNDPHKNTPWTLTIDPGSDYDRQHGDSIAVNGACLSDVGDAHVQLPLIFHVSDETLAKTSLKALKPGSLVNLERAMKLSDRLGGHVVLGHVDGIATITRLEEQGDFWFLSLKISHELSCYIAKKGSLAIDGISLTVNDIVDNSDHAEVSFMIIPITWKTTRLKTLSKGDIVNIETDILAKHVERILKFKS